MKKRLTQMVVDRSFCEWILALFRVIIGGCAVAAVIGGFKFYGNFQVATKTLQEMEQQIRKGILPKTEIIVAQLMEIVKTNRRDIERNQTDLEKLRDKMEKD